MKPRLDVFRRTLSTTLMLAAVGCASDPAADPDVDEPDIDEPDTTAPLVVSTSPAANEIGVDAMATITVTFSEPMDPATIEAEWSSQQLPLDNVSFEWNAELTVVTIRPKAPLLYAEGQGTDVASVPAFTYSVTLGGAAADLAGNPLGTPLQLTFATKRRMTASFPLDVDFTRVQTTISSLANTEIMIGDGSAGNFYRSYLTFDLSALPAGAMIESAEFSARQLAAEGDPYTLGPVNVQHVRFVGLTAALLKAAPALSLPGMFSGDDVLETKSIDVTAQVTDDVLHRSERSDRSQYRLLIDETTDDDGVTDRALFAKDTFELAATYVVD